MGQFEIAIVAALAAGIIAAILVVAAYFVGSPTPGWLALLTALFLVAAVAATAWAALVS